ncbi:MAG: NAD(P)H-binding protein [Pseudomonadota bacterium]
MNILLTGANGFLGRYLLARLVTAGHNVIPAVRRPVETDRLLSVPTSIAVDFNRDTRPEDWIPRLAGVDVVINCSGILQGRPSQSIQAIHADAPKALFAACKIAGVTRVIQISAISAKAGAGTAYAETKRDADDYLATTDLDWVILRPSLVYGEGAYGGTALFRAFAALPFILPVIGKGEQVFQPIHIDDVSATILALLADSSIRRTIIDPVGTETLTLRQILIDLRRWLGYSPARVIEIPLMIIKIAAKIGDFVGGPINTTALRQLAFGNVGEPAAFVKSTGIQPRRWHAALLARPSQAQDRWHARMYFLRPLLRWALAVMWLVSGIVGLGQPANITDPLMAGFGLSGIAAQVAVWMTSVADIMIGIALLSRWRPSWICVIQLAFVAAYTIGLTLTQPVLWLDLFGPILKNVPIMAAILVLVAVETDR